MKQVVQVLLLICGLFGVATASDLQHANSITSEDKLPDAMRRTAMAIGKGLHSGVDRGTPLPEGNAQLLQAEFKKSVLLHLSSELTHSMTSTRLESTTRAWQADSAYISVCRSHHITVCAIYGPLSALERKTTVEGAVAPVPLGSAASEPN